MIFPITVSHANPYLWLDFSFYNSLPPLYNSLHFDFSSAHSCAPLYCNTETNEDSIQKKYSPMLDARHSAIHFAESSEE